MIKNVVVLDIDGVLADYRNGLLLWVKKNYPEFQERCDLHLGRSDTWIDEASMEIPFREWLDVLEAFRYGGGKLHIPVFAGVPELFASLKRKEFKIVLVTSRPIDIYSNIYRDTVEWLRALKLDYQLLLWSKSKAEIVHKLRLVDEIRFAVDDELGHVEAYAKLGIKTYWLDHYSKGSPKDWKNIYRVQNLYEVVQTEEI